MSVAGYHRVKTKNELKSSGEKPAYASPRFLNKHDDLFRNSENIKPIEGYEDIVVHGDLYSFIFKDADGKESNVPVKEFADMLRKSPTYKGGNIRLVSCETAAEGAITAQALADELGVTVLAPNDVVLVYPDGKMIIGLTGGGKWVKLKPRKGE